MQQFLIPSPNGSSQIVSIPLSLLSNANQQPISFITSNGQIYQIPSIPQLVIHQNNENKGANQVDGGENSGGTGTGGSDGNASQKADLTAKIESKSPSTVSVVASSSLNNTPSSANAPKTTITTATTVPQQQTFVLNHQGQLISLPVLQAAGNPNNVTKTIVNGQQAIDLQQITISALSNSTNSPKNALIHTSNAKSAETKGNSNGMTPVKADMGDDSNSSEDEGPKISNIATGGNVTHATTVDGVNLDEIREFAKAFKLRRLALGLTQTQVGQALSATKGPAYSQSAICRFEKLDITPKSAAKIKPVLQKWMQDAELKYADRLKSGSHQNFADLLGTENAKKRKRRTSFTPQALEILNEYFEKNTHPSGNQGADMTMLAKKLNYDREVIRVWFCNKRQALKNTLKKVKQGNGTESDEFASSDQEQLSSSSTNRMSSTPTTYSINIYTPPATESSASAARKTPTSIAEEYEVANKIENLNELNELNLLASASISTLETVVDSSKKIIPLDDKCENGLDIVASADTTDKTVIVSNTNA